MHYILRIIPAVLLIGSFLAITGCEGPEGPAGKDGASIQGPKGEPGEPGTANVIYSPWKSVTNNMWTRTTEQGVVRFIHDISAPPIDQAVLDRGLVMVYVKLSQDNNVVRPLPFNVASNLTLIRLEYALLDKKVRILSTDPDQNRNLTPPDGQYRYVIIPGSQAGRLGVADLTYEALSARFNIKD